MRSAPTSVRLIAALMLALLLALRSLSPAGFMPAFDRGSVTIVSCPDFAPEAAHHGHQGDHKRSSQPCPYAAGASFTWVEPSAAVTLALLLFLIPLLIAPVAQVLERSSTRQRPPPRGPPIPA